MEKPLIKFPLVCWGWRRLYRGPFGVGGWGWRNLLQVSLQFVGDEEIKGRLRGGGNC